MQTSDKETIKPIYPFNDLIYENLGVDALSKLKNLRKNELINQQTLILFSSQVLLSRTQIYDYFKFVKLHARVKIVCCPPTSSNLLMTTPILMTVS